MKHKVLMAALLSATLISSTLISSVYAAPKSDKISYMQDLKKANGVYKVGKTYHYFDQEGKLYQGKAKLVHAVNGIYYVKKDGTTFHGWNIVNNHLYNFAGKGNKALTNTTSRSVKLLSSGIAVKNEDSEIFIRVVKILKKLNVAEASAATKRRALWQYLTSHAHFSYYMKYPNLKTNSWAKDYALWMLDNRRGNCYGFACTFAAMCYVAGYNPQIVCGRVHGSRDGARDGFTRHACLKINGKWYDPEATFAGWMRGVYGAASYRAAFISRKSYSYAAQNGNKTNITVTAKGKTYYYTKGNTIYGFDENNQPLTGYYVINNKIYYFNKKHTTTKQEAKKLQKLFTYKAAFSPIKNLLGQAKDTKDMGPGCSGINGTEMLYTYDHIKVGTVIPYDGSAEIFLSVSEI